MEFFKNANIDFLGKKWYFIAFSLIFSVAGVVSLIVHHGPNWGIDFRAGTLVYVKFSHAPDDNAARAAMDRAGLHNARIQSYGSAGSNEVLIDLPVEVTSEQALDQGKIKIINALQSNAPAGKQDLNNTSSLSLNAYLRKKDPLHLGTDADQSYAPRHRPLWTTATKRMGGVLASMDQLKGVTDPAVLASLQDGFFLSDFGVYR